MSAPTTLLPFQPAAMSTAQLVSVSYLARYAGRTHALYAYQLRESFSWCEGNELDPLAGIQRAHVELYIRGLGDRGLMDSSVNTTIHAVRGCCRLRDAQILARHADPRTAEHYSLGPHVPPAVVQRRPPGPVVGRPGRREGP